MKGSWLFVLLVLATGCLSGRLSLDHQWGEGDPSYFVFNKLKAYGEFEPRTQMLLPTSGPWQFLEKKRGEVIVYLPGESYGSAVGFFDATLGSARAELVSDYRDGNLGFGWEAPNGVRVNVLRGARATIHIHPPLSPAQKAKYEKALKQALEKSRSRQKTPSP